jgi:hypothetical protein
MVAFVPDSQYGVMLGRRVVTGPWGTGGLVWAAVTAAACLAAGTTTFRVLERITRAHGKATTVLGLTQYVVTSANLKWMAAATPPRALPGRPCRQIFLTPADSSS